MTSTRVVRGPKKLLIYMPVLHAGYVNFLRSEIDAHRGSPDFSETGIEEVLLLGEDILDEYREIQKDIRKLPAAMVKEILELMNLTGGVAIRIVDRKGIVEHTRNSKLVIPNEELVYRVFDDYALGFSSEGQYGCGDAATPIDSANPTFLRWSKSNSKKKVDVVPDTTITEDEAHQSIMALASEQAELSGDWWRQVGAVLVSKSGEMVAGFNRHMPNEYAPYENGDPRASASRGVDVDVATSLHAEASVLAQCARNGVVTAGASLYVTTFPCAGCARLIGEAGVDVLFFSDGYSVLEGAESLSAAGTGIVRVLPRPIA